MCSNIKLHLVAISLVLIGALNWGFTALNYNLVEMLASVTHENVATGIYALVALSALYLMFNRDTYLPFLGQSAFPCGLLQDSQPTGASLPVSVSNLLPDSKVVYWAAEPSNSTDRDYIAAYTGYQNAGVTSTDANGAAVFSVRPPAGYRVPGRTLQPHIHFRVCLKNGLMGEVQTVNV